MTALEILGLPLHPLVVHLVVVALPVGALGTIAAVVSPWVRARYGVLALVTLTVGALASVAAMLTGNILAETETRPEQHAGFGTWTVIAALVTAVIAWVWWLLERRREQAPPGNGGFAAMVAGGLAVTGALAATGLTVATGHSGAEATWGTRASTPITGAPATPGGTTTNSGTPSTPSGSSATAPTGSTSSSPDASATPTAATDPSYTLAEVATRNSAESCWAAINGDVYDLTRWINQHPGGASRILGLCGTDATAQFDAQHGGQGRPERTLESFRIGTLAA
ncbi:MAG: cytochrome b5 domain-containing protein [Propioniciclava sp.]|uniref:cytochrome b5 domain-containing protein n=1 Tax=Propioniciclava sp. TaxID=2038686 RepID=UPI0039E6BC67